MMSMGKDEEINIQVLLFGILRDGKWHNDVNKFINKKTRDSVPILIENYMNISICIIF